MEKALVDILKERKLISENLVKQAKNIKNKNKK